MPVHSVLVLNGDAEILFRKYFVDGCNHLEIERVLWRALSTTGGTETKIQRALNMSVFDMYTVIAKIDELQLIINGQDDTDEIICKITFLVIYIFEN